MRESLPAIASTRVSVGAGADVAPVQRQQPGRVEPRRRAAHGVEAEPRDGIGHADHLVVAVAPTQTQQMVAHRFGQDSLVAPRAYRERAVPFGQLRPVGAVDQRYVGEGRPLPAERGVDLALAKGIGQMIVAANDVRDVHVVIVHDDRQRVGRRSVGTQQDHVVELVVGDGHGSLDRVLDRRLPFERRPETDDRLHVRRRIRRIAVAPRSVVQPRPAFGAGSDAHRLELVRPAVATIGHALGEQATGHFGMTLRPVCLADGLAVPVQTEPGQPVVDGRHGRFRRTRAVGVLDAQQEAAAMTPREQPVEQGRAGAAHVQMPCRRGSETGHDAHGLSSFLEW